MGTLSKSKNKYIEQLEDAAFSLIIVVVGAFIFMVMLYDFLREPKD